MVMLWVFVFCCLILGGLFRLLMLHGARQIRNKNPINMELSSDGFFLDLWAFNERNIQVFPHLKAKQGAFGQGLDITLTGKKEDYHLVSLEQFINHIANGDFDKVGRVRMKPRSGGQSNGFAVRKAIMSPILKEEIKERRKGRRIR